MILLDAIEQAVGTEYLGDTQHAEPYTILQQEEIEIALVANPQQPNSNKIVHVR